MTWHPGDPIAPGRVYLPDAETRRQYGEAVRAELVEHKARKVLAGETRAERRSRLEAVPEDLREAVRERVEQLWSDRNGEIQEETGRY